ncbi:4-oxalomesaconate tautomerase [Hyphococcus sp.]|uniref:4-oxalomesaconate tautomerase n=1 Tax=Hyphococcus sp. TaxID=2038636 RepID=UPI003CCBA6E5
MLRAIPATLMRGGTSKGLYFNAADLPSNEAARNAVLLAAMGSPDPRQIDGVGGAHPLTSKIAVLSPSDHPDADVDYLFLQAAVNERQVSNSQPCGNILAGVGPWAVENGLIAALQGETRVRIRTINNGSLAVATVQTPGGIVEYEGDAAIDGVPGAAAPVSIEFLDIAGSNCGSLLPTGNIVDKFAGVEATCIDNGMPVVLLRARDFGLTGDETPASLEANDKLKSQIEAIRLEAGFSMNLGDVKAKTVPKMTLVSPPRGGGALSTRTFIPHRVHEAIGVLGAVSVAAAAALPGSVAASVSKASAGWRRMDIEHPSGFFTVDLELEKDGEAFAVKRCALLRTARLLMRGEIYIPSAAWSAA